MTNVTSDGLCRRRYQIVPQMRDYDTLEKKAWLPYVMIFHPADLRTASFSTDSEGFRITWQQGKELSMAEYNRPEGIRAALIGGSAAFGVGASSDQGTLASVLNQTGDRVWFNFAGRGFNSTQELLIFLLHLPRDVKTVLLFTGLNNLVLSFLSGSTSPVYNSFYAQSVFERGLQAGEVTGMQGAFRLLLREITHRLSAPPDRNGSKPMGCWEAYEHIRVCFQRDLRLWSLLRDAMGFDLYFAFQPMASWTHKALSSEEAELFALLDAGAGQRGWDHIAGYLQEQKRDYIADVSRICREQAIPFVDLNQTPAMAQPDWLFVDRAHLTDAGYRRAAEAVRGAFPL
jgi:hypothetical protein